MHPHPSFADAKPTFSSKGRRGACIDDCAYLNDLLEFTYSCPKPETR
jgi:hypothetical protein